MFSIGLLSTSSEAVPRLRAAVRERASVVPCSSPDALLTAIGARHIALAIIEVRGAAARGALAALRDVRHRFPRHPIVVWCDVRSLETRDLLAIAQLGVRDLLREDGDDLPFTLGNVITAAMQRTVHGAIAEALGDAIPRRIMPIFEYALEHAGEHLDRDDVAAAFGISRRTLHNRLADAGLPATRTFLTWCRLFVASALLEQQGTTLDSVAGQLDFGDGSVLAVTLRRYTGTGILALRREGALAATAAAFRQRVRRDDAGQTVPTLASE